MTTTEVSRTRTFSYNKQTHNYYSVVLIGSYQIHSRLRDNN